MVNFSCIKIPPSQELVTASLWEAPTPTDPQRCPCPFINTLANHGIIDPNGTLIDIFDLVTCLEAIYHLVEELMHSGPAVQLAIDCNQT
jgi:hypothetical protein